MIKGLIKKLLKLYYRFKNSDPVNNCPVYKDEGCSLVDGPVCPYPKCNLIHEHLGHNFIFCSECFYNECCSSNQYGLGCYDGKINIIDEIKKS